MKTKYQSVYVSVPRIQQTFPLGEYIDDFHTTINLKKEQITNQNENYGDDWQSEQYEFQDSTDENIEEEENPEQDDFGEFMYFL
jgi:hypothetical protein